MLGMTEMWPLRLIAFSLLAASVQDTLLFKQGLPFCLITQLFRMLQSPCVKQYKALLGKDYSLKCSGVGDL